MAPELGQVEYIYNSIDIWSFGIVLYELATTYKPTQVKGFKYGSAPIPFVKSDWRKRKVSLQDLVKRCLEVDPAKRITAAEALDHEWFSDL